MTAERRKIVLIFSFLNASIILSVLLFCLYFEPEKIIEKGGSYTCVFQNLLGIYCPACGGTRSLGYLFSFDLVNSFIHYPPILIGIFLILFVDFMLIKSYFKNSLEPLNRHKYFEFLLIPISIILTFLTRNILLCFGIDVLKDILV